MFFTALGTHPCLCPRISKEWADFREARVNPWYMQTHAFWEGPAGRPVSREVYSFLQAIAVCFLSEQGREQVGKGTIECVWRTQVFKIRLWACSVLTVPGTGDVFQRLPVSLRQ